jgi:YhcH/YjgK/YiaL family protein
MKNVFLRIMVFLSLAGLCGCTLNTDPSGWSQAKTDKWFENGGWRNGWPVKPDPSINKALFAKAYFKNRGRWNKAFSFLKNSDLATLELKRYDLDGDDLFATASVYNTRNPEDAKFEAHRKYIDLQYVVSGSELIGIAPLVSRDSILQQYDATKDIELLSVKQGMTVRATPDRFFIFFPEDAHMPGLKEGTNAPVRKVVVKIRMNGN